MAGVAASVSEDALLRLPPIGPRGGSGDVSPLQGRRTAPIPMDPRTPYYNISTEVDSIMALGVLVSRCRSKSHQRISSLCRVSVTCRPLQMIQTTICMRTCLRVGTHACTRCVHVCPNAPQAHPQHTRIHRYMHKHTHLPTHKHRKEKNSYMQKLITTNSMPTPGACR